MIYADYQKTPIDAIDVLGPYVVDKTVYELGAGEGEFAEGLKHYAKEVVAVEMQPDLAEQCEKRGLRTIRGDFVDVNLEEADVIFCFLSMIGNYVLTKKLYMAGWKGTVISHFHPLQMAPMEPIKSDEELLVNKRVPFLVYNVDFSL